MINKKRFLLSTLHNLLLRDSLTPDDKGCQQYIYDLLKTQGFLAVNCDYKGITNTLYFHTNDPQLLAKYKEVALEQAANLKDCKHISELDFPFLGEDVFAFAGHTDVVPTGPVETWKYSPFSGYITKENTQGTEVVFPAEDSQDEGKKLLELSISEHQALASQLLEAYSGSDLVLHGRGATDMKGGLAAAISASYHYVKANPQHLGTVALLVTSDEEGIAHYGTKYVVEELKRCKQGFSYCIVGEPSSSNVFGDTIRIGRRGSATFSLTVHGTQGHVAYPHLVDNPLHKVAPLMAELGKLKLDKGTKEFPATSLQIVDFHGGDGTVNLVPGTCKLTFNIRFNNLHTYKSLSEDVAILLERHRLSDCTQVESSCSGESFVTPSKTPLVSFLLSAIPALTTFKGNPNCDTGGGTSDGRFICKICPQIVEFGTTNATLHKVNEHVRFTEVDQLEKVYLGCLINFLNKENDDEVNRSLNLKESGIKLLRELKSKFKKGE